MNILILNWRDIKHPLSGGAEESLMRHAKFWHEQGASVDWFSSLTDGLKPHEKSQGLTYIRRGSHYTVHLFAFLYFFRNKKKQYDVIIDCFHFIPFFSVFYFKKTKIIALINEPARNAWFKNILLPLSVIGYLVEPVFFKFYKKNIFITSAQSIVDELTIGYGLKKDNIKIIPHGVTVMKIAKIPKEKNPTILYASRITQDKGIENAVKVIKLLYEKYANLQFWIIGKSEDNVYLSKIKHMVKEYKIENITTFYGFVSQEKKFKLMQKAWCLIHPSIREGWGLNVIEANFYGTPAVGYNVVGLRDSIINEKTGLLTKKNNFKELAVKIDTLIQKVHIRKELSRNAKVYASNFTWEKAGKKSWKIIKSISKKE